MTKNYLEFYKKYECKKYTVFENKNWIVSLRPEQKTPFSFLICLKSNVYELRKLTSKQLLDLRECYNYIENVSYDKLGAKKVNYACLMMVDSIVHYHVFPRFESDLNILGKTLKDVYYPKPVDILDGHSIDIELIKKCLESL